MLSTTHTSLNKVRWNYVRSVANDLTAIYSAPPIPVLEIAQQNGVNVVFTSFGVHAETVAGFCDFKNAKIYVNKDERIGRQTFTIAHELGHWMLHREFFNADPNQYAVLLRFQKPKNSPMETEANLFAAELLAPTRLLQPVKGAAISTLANIFGVSREMMEHRLKNV